MAVKWYNNFNGTTNFSDVTARFHLTATTELTYTIPGEETQYYQAFFNYGSSAANVYVGYNSTVTVPAANATETTGFVESKPELRIVKGGDVIHLITPDANVYMGLSLRSLPSGK